jgi:hypothetical protein
MIEFVREMTAFLFSRKKYWLMPVLVMMSILGFVIVFTQGSALAPFIYALF